jgi:FkbM family methyltransferase
MKRIFSFFWMFILKISKKKLFCVLLNIRNFIKRKKIYFRFVDNFYILKQNKKSWFFKNKYRLLRNVDGLEKRAEQLHDIYQLKNTNINDQELIVDIGANYGEFFNVFDLILKKKINYISVEPSNDCYVCLKKSIPNQKHINSAIYNKKIKKNFFLSEDTADSSLIEPQKFSDFVEIETKTLNDIINQDVTLLKVEAEGAEPEIILNLRDLDYKIKYIVVDVSFERGKKKLSTEKRCLTILKSYGYYIKSEYRSNERVVILFERSNNDN